MKRLNHKVLLVSFFFPPRPSIGSLRAEYLAHYLPTEGWDVTVLTANYQGYHPPAWSNVVETGYTDVVAEAKRLFGLSPAQSTYRTIGVDIPKITSRAKLSLRQRIVFGGYRLLTYPDPMRGWYKYASRTLSDLVGQNRYDAIISTSPPVTAHFAVAKSLKRGTPWIADLRDLWTGNPYYPGGLRRALDSVLEHRILSKARAITTVSKPLAAIVARAHPAIPVFAVPNAFDPGEWKDIPFVSPQKCSLTYAGHMRDPSVLLEAIAQQIETGSISPESFELNLYTDDAAWLRSEVDERGLSRVVNFRGIVPRGEVLRAERSASANIVLLSYLPGEEAGYTAKLFEYFGAGRLIIGIGPPQSAVAELLARAGGLYASNVHEAQHVLRTIYQAHVENRTLSLNSEVLNQYTASMLARRFAKVLDSATAQGPKVG